MKNLKKHCKLVITFIFVMCCSIFIINNTSYAYTDNYSAKNTKSKTFDIWIQGAHSISANVTNKKNKIATFKLYKNYVSKNNLITTHHGTTFTRRKVLKSGNQHYKLVITYPVKTNMKCTVSQLIDKKNTTKPTIWEPNVFENSPGTGTQVQAKVFFPKAQAEDAIKMISNDKYLTFYDKALKAGIAGGTTLLANNVKVIGKVSSNVFVNMGIAYKGLDVNLSLKKLSVNKLKKVAGYNTKTKKASKNVCITYTHHWGGATPFTSIDYSTYNGKTCTGAPGYSGTFREYK